MTNTPLHIDDETAMQLSDQLIETATTANIDVLSTYAAFQLATLSVAALILGVATEPANFEHNKRNLVELAEHTTKSIKDLTPETVNTLRDAALQAQGAVH